MTTKRMAEIIEELAETEGKTPERFLLGIVESAEKAKIERFNSLPPEIRSEIADAEEAKRESRAQKRRARDVSRFDDQLAAFTVAFPGVRAEDIPEKVWQDVADGIPMAYAYAYERMTAGKTSDDINAENEARSLPVAPGRAEQAAFTEAEVEKMTPAAVKSNFARIIDSMRKWRS